MPSEIKFIGPNGADPQQALTDALDVLPSEEAMLNAAGRQITRIRERTEQGKDVNGSEFTPYSEKYAKRREKKGRNVTPVDLTMSGRMLNSMTPEVRSPSQFAITVMDADAAIYGRAHNEGTDKLPQRRFFDVNEEEIAALQTDLFGFDK